MIHANIQNIDYARLHPQIVLNSFSDTMFLRKHCTISKGRGCYIATS
jgi:hypothetical protein